MRIFFIVLLLVPILELALLIAIGREIGVLSTLLWLFVDVLAGIFLMKNVGPVTALRMRERLMAGDMPNREMLDGLFVGLAGLLLLFPGILSDFAAILCLLPVTRHALRDVMIRRTTLRNSANSSTFQQYSHVSESFSDIPKSPSVHRPEVIEGEWERRKD